MGDGDFWLKNFRDTIQAHRNPGFNGRANPETIYGSGLQKWQRLWVYESGQSAVRICKKSEVDTIKSIDFHRPLPPQTEKAGNTLRKTTMFASRQAFPELIEN